MSAEALYEIRAEPDEGFSLPRDGGRPTKWIGVRIRYRRLGARGRFRSFLLSVDGDKVPTIAQMQEACAVHEARQGPGRRLRG